VRSCRHVYGESFYNPIEKPNHVVVRYETQGVHRHPITEQQGVTREDQWTRACKLCGHEQHTKKQKSVRTAPDFG
jgi:hypothetical protein